MFSPGFCDFVQIMDVTMLNSGDIIVRRTMTQLLFGVYIDTDTIITQLVPNDLKKQGCQIIICRYKEFSANAEILKCIFSYFSSPNDIIRRASSVVNTKYNEGIFSISGDDFIHYCVTGTTMSQELDSIDTKTCFGEHILVPFTEHEGTIQGLHHGIGIENQNVIHFHGEDDVVGKKTLDLQVQITSLSEFTHGNIDILRRYEYKESNRFSKLYARNRAINSLFLHDFSTYNLFFKNCEHLAYWCATGKSQSPQIGELVEGGAMLLLAGLSALSGKPHLGGFHFSQKKLGKFIKPQNAGKLVWNMLNNKK